MKKKWILILGILIGLASLSSCASYKPMAVVPDLGQNDETVNIRKDGIIAIAYPIRKAEDVKKYFDYSGLVRDGVLPVYISVANTSNQESVKILLSLESPNGENVKPLSAEDVYPILKKGWLLRAGAWSLLWIPLAPISMIDTAMENKKVMKDIKGKQFKEEIAPGLISQGYVFFKINEEIKTLNGFWLAISFGDGRILDKLPLKGSITAD